MRFNPLTAHVAILRQASLLNKTNDRREYSVKSHLYSWPLVGRHPELRFKLNLFFQSFQEARENTRETHEEDVHFLHNAEAMRAIVLHKLKQKYTKCWKKNSRVMKSRVFYSSSLILKDKICILEDMIDRLLAVIVTERLWMEVRHLRLSDSVH